LNVDIVVLETMKYNREGKWKGKEFFITQTVHSERDINRQVVKFDYTSETCGTGF